MTEARYRPEIDGLRALAVLAVVVFHLDRAWLPGGFAGVDVFFVLSGYLITGILLRSMRAEQFSFAAFYQRRIARIFPAFLLMALVTLGAAALIYTGWDLASTAKAFATALLSTANFHLLMQGDYFQMSADAQPMLHCWSLAVEEQFYLLLPVGLWWMRRWPPAKITRMLAALTAGSLMLCVVLTPQHPAGAFYLLPSRAWELLAGSLLAARESADPQQTAAAAPRSWRVLFAAGMATLVASFVLLAEGPAFPGFAALLPVGGTVAVLMATRRGAGLRWLSAAPLRLVGRVSYSLYLWHWPVFSLVDYGLIFASPGARLAVKLTLTLVLTVISYRYVETPCRRWLNATANRRTGYWAFGLTLAALVPATYALGRHLYIDAASSRSGSIHFPAAETAPRVLLMGDSQACMFANVLRDVCAEERLNFTVIARAGTDPLNGGDSPPGALWQSSLEAVREQRPDVLILSCHWIYKLQPDPKRLRSTIAGLQPYCGHILLLPMPPLLPESAQRPAIRAGNRPPFHENAEDRRLRRQMDALLAAVVADGVSVLDTAGPFVNPRGELLAYAPGRHFIPELWFHSNAHLSEAGTLQLRQQFQQVLRTPGRKN